MSQTHRPPIDEACRQAYCEQGVVCLRNVIDPEWLEKTQRGIQRDWRAPGQFFRDQTPEHSPAKYLFSYWSWPQVPEFEALLKASPIAPLVADLLQAKTLNLLMDNWFVREAGAKAGAPWHHDEPYFDFDGGQKCVFWFPIEPVPKDMGLTFLAGSHRWGKLFMPSNFREQAPFEGDMQNYHAIDSVDFDDPQHQKLSWDMQPGDALAFDFRTLHAATAGNQPLEETVHRMSLRFGDEAVRFQPRGQWTEETSAHLQQLGCVPGGAVDCALLPRLASRA